MVSKPRELVYILWMGVFNRARKGRDGRQTEAFSWYISRTGRLHWNLQNIIIPLQILCSHVAGEVGSSRATHRDMAICIDSHKKLPKSKVLTSALYIIVREAVCDPLFNTSYSILSMWQEAQIFLTAFQTDALKVPFLAKELQSILIHASWRRRFSRTSRHASNRSESMNLCYIQLWKAPTTASECQMSKSSLGWFNNKKFVFSCRVDAFLRRFASGKAEYENLWKLLKGPFTLSHGQQLKEDTRRTRTCWLDTWKRGLIGASTTKPSCSKNAFSTWKMKKKKNDKKRSQLQNHKSGHKETDNNSQHWSNAARGRYNGKEGEKKAGLHTAHKV